MEWKSYYADECRAAGARKAIEAWLVTDAALYQAVRRRAVVSFPHTALRYAGPRQARLVRALYETEGVERVLALGVLHGSGIEPYRTALDAAAPAARRTEGYAEVRGAFLACDPEVETPFSAGRVWDAELCSAVRVDPTGLLAGEFSLDTFRGVVRVAADYLGRRPLPVLCVYVGMTRDPVSGSFGVADELAGWLRAHVSPSTALVATGDLVHYGTAYGGAWLPGNPASGDALERPLRRAVEHLLAAAFVKRDREAAYRLSRERLGNDQRELLAPLSGFMGPGARATLHEFELSDYAGILDVAPPCVVASALGVYERAPAIVAA